MMIMMTMMNYSSTKTPISHSQSHPDSPVRTADWTFVWYRNSCNCAPANARPVHGMCAPWHDNCGTIHFYWHKSPRAAVARHDALLGSSVGPMHWSLYNKSKKNSTTKKNHHHPLLFQSQGQDRSSIQGHHELHCRSSSWRIHPGFPPSMTTKNNDKFSTDLGLLPDARD